MIEIESFELDPNQQSFTVGQTHAIIARLTVLCSKGFYASFSISTSNKFFFVLAGNTENKTMESTQRNGSSLSQSFDVAMKIKMKAAGHSAYVRITARLEDTDGITSAPVGKNLNL